MLWWPASPIRPPCLFLTPRKSGSAGHRGSWSWIDGRTRPHPECGPLERVRWEGPRWRGVLRPAAGGAALFRLSVGATLWSAPRAGRAGRRAGTAALGVTRAAEPLASLARPPHSRPPALRRGSKEMPTQRDSSTMSHPVAGGCSGDHAHQVRVKAYYRG